PGHAAAVDADSCFRERHRLIGAPVGWPFEAALKLQARHAPAAVVAGLYLHRRAATWTALNMGVDLPVSHILIMSSCDLVLVGEAGAVGAVHFSPRQRIDSELHHEEVHPEHHAEEREQHEKHLAPGQRLRRSDWSAHSGLPRESHGVTKLSVADATSPSPISVTRNFTGTDFSELFSEGAVTRSLSSVV